MTARDDDEADGGATTYLHAVGLAFQAAASQIGETYVIDDVARAKLIAVIVRVARRRMRSSPCLWGQSDIDAVTHLAVEHFLALQPVASAARVRRLH